MYAFMFVLSSLHHFAWILVKQRNSGYSGPTALTTFFYKDSSMRPVQLFDIVSVSYTATLPSGEIVESTPEGKPLILPIGSGQILKAVEASLLGMEPGQTRTVHIQPEDAFGPYRQNLVQEVPRAVFGDRIDPRPGMILSLNMTKDGANHQVPATILASGNETVTVDYNHPLAGQVITYTVTLHAVGN